MKQLIMNNMKFQEDIHAALQDLQTQVGDLTTMANQLHFKRFGHNPSQTILSPLEENMSAGVIANSEVVVVQPSVVTFFANVVPEVSDSVEDVFDFVEMTEVSTSVVDVADFIEMAELANSVEDVFESAEMTEVSASASIVDVSNSTEMAEIVHCVHVVADLADMVEATYSVMDVADLVERIEDANSMINISVNSPEIVKFGSVDVNLADGAKIADYVVDMSDSVKVIDSRTDMSGSIDMAKIANFVVNISDFFDTLEILDVVANKSNLTNVSDVGIEVLDLVHTDCECKCNGGTECSIYAEIHVAIVEGPVGAEAVVVTRAESDSKNQKSAESNSIARNQKGAKSDSSTGMKRKPTLTSERKSGSSPTTWKEPILTVTIRKKTSLLPDAKTTNRPSLFWIAESITKQMPSPISVTNFATKRESRLCSLTASNVDNRDDSGIVDSPLGQASVQGILDIADITKGVVVQFPLASKVLPVQVPLITSQKRKNHDQPQPWGRPDPLKTSRLDEVVPAKTSSSPSRFRSSNRLRPQLTPSSHGGFTYRLQWIPNQGQFPTKSPYLFGSIPTSKGRLHSNNSNTCHLGRQLISQSVSKKGLSRRTDTLLGDLTPQYLNIIGGTQQLPLAIIFAIWMQFLKVLSTDGKVQKLNDERNWRKGMQNSRKSEFDGYDQEILNSKDVEDSSHTNNISYWNGWGFLTYIMKTHYEIGDLRIAFGTRVFLFK
ncbi:hypothetical protein CR513_28487, partial [Mucuna pruriens]